MLNRAVAGWSWRRWGRERWQDDVRSGDGPPAAEVPVQCETATLSSLLAIAVSGNSTGSVAVTSLAPLTLERGGSGRRPLFHGFGIGSEAAFQGISVVV